MHIVSGYYEKTRLDNVNVAFAFHFPGPLHEGNGALQLYIDDMTTAAQPRGAAGDPQRLARRAVVPSRRESDREFPSADIHAGEV